MTAQDYISRFNRFNGNPLKVATLKAYRTDVQNYIDSVGSGYGIPELKDILERCNKVLKGKPADGVFDNVIVDPIVLKPAPVKVVAKKKTLAKPAPVVEKKVEKKAVKKKKPVVKKHILKAKPIKPKAKELSPGMKAVLKELEKPAPKRNLSGVDYKFSAIKLGPYVKEFYRMNSDSNVMIWGLPGHGKTVFLLQFAQYLAERGYKVLYISAEEYGKSTLAEKLTKFNIDHPNLTITGALNESDIEANEVVFFDSITRMKITADRVDELDKKYPNRLFLLINQSTKDGGYKGGAEWEHLVDIAGLISNRNLILRKNRLDENNFIKSEELLTKDAITEARKKMKIREAVKNVQQQPIAA